MLKEDYQWLPFLKKLGQLLHDGVEGKLLCYDKSSVGEDKWLGFPPASDEAIAARETALGVELPPSYKAFLKTSNGFRQSSYFSGALLPVEQIDRLPLLAPELYEAFAGKTKTIKDKDYFNYSDNQEPSHFRIEYLEHALVIANFHDGAWLLLNPQVVHKEEMEAWLFASWLPGANRFRSFWDLMEFCLESTELLAK